jgi:AMP nucleosidase
MHKDFFKDSETLSGHGGARDLQEFTDAGAATARITEIYEKNTSKIRETYRKIASDKDSSANTDLLEGATYPYLGISVKPGDLNVDARVSFGAALEAGVYGSTLTRPDIFQKYYRNQIDLLLNHHNVPVVVGESNWPIPLPFVELSDIDTPNSKDPFLFDDAFALPNLSLVNDDIVNGTYRPQNDEPLPLALFEAERVDLSLGRLHHYCGTSAEHFQKFILLTNYQRYVHEFIDYSMNEISNGDEYSAFVGPGDEVTHNPKFSDEVPSGERPTHLPQMPAYHLKRPDGRGITFINIGVGPSNAKTITDHLAVLRPHCWIMLGHCAGLRRSQHLGDYVLAHAYVREDHVLDQDLPAWIPIPALAEVQVALQQAVANITGASGYDLKSHMRTGTVVTTDNRNWELRSRELMERFRQSRAIALDMESGTVAANGFRMRVPYGTLLCVSDKPIHGELKLRGMAHDFYKKSVSQHLQIGIESLRILREEQGKGDVILHSRKLRSFDEPPMR